MNYDFVFIYNIFLENNAISIATPFKAWFEINNKVALAKT